MTPIHSRSTSFLLLLLILACVGTTAAFIPQKNLLDLQGWMSPKKAADDTQKSLRSSRAEPLPSTAADTKTYKKPTLLPEIKVASKANAEVLSTNAVKQHASAYKRWGVDNTNEEEYWFDNRIHTLGNRGFMGAVS